MSSRTLIGALAVAVLIVIIIAVRVVVARRRRRTINQTEYLANWKALQKNCATRKTWPLAVVEADELLDRALRCQGFKGKTTGERLVSAQHTLSSNDAVWFSHKMRKKIENEDVRKLKKQDVLEALTGFRQALKDLGALPS